MGGAGQASGGAESTSTGSTSPAELRLHRILLASGGAAYLVWWGFVELTLPGAFNPIASRLGVVACFWLVLAASHASPRLATRLPDALAACCVVLTAHYFYLLECNHADLEWVVGSYITITAICAILQTARSLLLYSVAVALMSVVLLIRETELSFVVFMPGTMTILLFANVGLRGRLVLLARLQEGHQRIESHLAARKQAEAELVAANRELEAFSYSVAHDLRAPLRSIDGFSRILVEEHAAALDDSSRGYLLKVRAAAQRMGQLIDDLLELANVGRAEVTRKRLDVSQLAAEVIAQLRAQDPTREVTCHIQPDIVVDADARLLHILLENLLGNAWKFTAKTHSAAIDVRAQTRDEGFVLSVADNGAGFDMAFVTKLFGPFQRLHRRDEFPGTGIGLATVQRIVHRHGGRVWAEGAVNHGATFHLTLGPQSARLSSVQ